MMLREALKHTPEGARSAAGGLCGRMPPVVFAPILGMLALGLAWREVAGQVAGQADLQAVTGMIAPWLGGPLAAWAAVLAEGVLGAATCLSLFALVCYGRKALRRPGVVLEDLRVLPGRAGLASAVLCLHLMALALAPYLPGQAMLLLAPGLIAHGAFNLVLAYVLARGPKAQRRVSPVWHLGFTGWIVAALAAVQLGQGWLAAMLFWVSLLAAVCLWVIALQGAARGAVPGPLRPLLVLHLAPAALLGVVSFRFGAQGLSQAFAVLTGLGLVLIMSRLRWLLAAGVSPLWGCMAFPLALVALTWLSLGGIWALPGAAVLAVASLMVPWITLRLLRGWAEGRLAGQTNAARA